MSSHRHLQVRYTGSLRTAPRANSTLKKTITPQDFRIKCQAPPRPRGRQLFGVTRGRQAVRKGAEMGAAPDLTQVISGPEREVICRERWGWTDGELGSHSGRCTTRKELVMENECKSKRTDICLHLVQCAALRRYHVRHLPEHRSKVIGQGYQALACTPCYASRRRYSHSPTLINHR